ncbi:MAG: hypothetical protein ACT4PQ_02825 [Betaproteobacteria bacterium]
MFLLLVGGAASGAQGIEALGSPLADLDRRLYSCAETGAHTLCRAVGKSVAHLGLPVLGMTLEYSGERLNQTTVLFDEARFADVEGRLRAGFGTPEHHDEQLRSGMAGAILNRVRVWRSGASVVMLEQFSGKITSSALRYLTADGYRELMHARDAVRVRGTRDL